MENKDLEKAKAKIFHYLEYRARSEQEIRRHFRSKIPAWVLDQVIEELTKKDFIDDCSFAEMFTKDRLRNGYGKKAIVFGLRAKGVPKQIIDEVVLKVDLDLEYKTAKEIASKKLKRVSEEKKREKMYQLLTRRGFSAQIIRKIVNNEDI